MSDSSYCIFLSDTMGFVVAMKKMKVEFFDRAGTKHTIAVEGDFTTEKIRQILECAQIVERSHSSAVQLAQAQKTKMDKLLNVVTTHFRDRSFDSHVIRETYRETCGDDFNLGAVSTYLSRLAHRNILERSGSPSHWFYRLKPSTPNQYPVQQE